MRLSAGLDALVHRRELRRWIALTERIDEMDAATLAETRRQASDLRAALDRTLVAAERRMSSPAAGRGKPHGPPGSDWAWRPSLFHTRLPVPGYAGATSGTAFGDEATIFHDCVESEISVSQRPGLGRAGTAPFVLALDVLGFQGSFLSLAVDLPRSAIEGLTLGHIVQVAMSVEAERPIEMFARLNLEHGPNVEQMVHRLGTAAEAEFDLAYSGIVEARVQRAWIDIIFDGPQMNRVELGDVVVSRRLRAEV